MHGGLKIVGLSVLNPAVDIPVKVTVAPVVPPTVVPIPVTLCGSVSKDR